MQALFRIAALQQEFAQRILGVLVSGIGGKAKPFDSLLLVCIYMNAVTV